MTDDIDVSQGAYCLAQMTDSYWGVFWTHPDHPDWFRLVAKFLDKGRAHEYAVSEADLLHADLARPDITKARPRLQKPTHLRFAS